ncbi:MAG: adenylate/guanylate cyclase domain-containing protein, partial [Spirochaetia bacterium]|nr:adenylate/guanylate cyclase domain-containing protein [Spirochaetia bacterium]
GGALFIMALYHLALYFLRQKEISNLFFSIMSLVTSLRSLTTGEVYLMHIFPNLPFDLFFKVDVLTIYIALPSLILFTSSLYPLDSNKWINRIFLVFSSLLIAIVIVTPPYIFSQSINAFVMIAFLGLIYTFFIIGRASIHKRDGAMIFIGGFSLIFSATINDMLHDNQVIDTGYFLAYGLFGFIFAQSFLLSRRFARAFMIVENLTDDLKKTNTALSRFVPREFLDLLLKESILDVRLGDQVQREMTVAFADIRNFTTLVENFTPEESFDFVNQYLSRMNPAIKKHGGFIDKYIGDAIMALFPADPEDAIDAAVEMFRALDVYNRERRANNSQDIRIGIGIHTGNLMLGTVGGEERMDGTVISESVNLTSRLESLTKIYGAPLIISNTTVDKLQSTKKYRMRVLDMVKVRGSTKNTFLIEVIDAELNPEIIEKKMLTRKKYLDGLYEFLNGNFSNSAEIFKELIKEFSEDKASNLLLTRSEHFLQFGPPEGWKNANFPGPGEKKLTEQVFG